MYTLKKGTKLYRASKTLEKKPKPRICSDTKKKGVYFSAFERYLAELMIIEYNENLIVAEYITTKNIKLKIGKYVSNESHISKMMGGIIRTKETKNPRRSTEVFLTEDNLSKIKYLSSYKMTVDNAKKKWLDTKNEKITFKTFKKGSNFYVTSKYKNKFTIIKDVFPRNTSGLVLLSKYFDDDYFNNNIMWNYDDIMPYKYLIKVELKKDIIFENGFDAFYYKNKIKYYNKFTKPSDDDDNPCFSIKIIKGEKYIKIYIPKKYITKSLNIIESSNFNYK